MFLETITSELKLCILIRLGRCIKLEYLLLIVASDQYALPCRINDKTVRMEF